MRLLSRVPDTPADAGADAAAKPGSGFWAHSNTNYRAVYLGIGV